MKKFIILFSSIFLISCNDIYLPELSDEENLTADAPVLDLDIVENDVESLESDLIIATVGGYDVPFSGKVFLSENEKIQDLTQIGKNKKIGSSTGSDIAVSTWDKGFFVIGRYDSSSIYFFTENGKGEFEFSEVKVLPEKALNLQDGIYSHLRTEFIISALNSNSLIILKDGEISELRISENANASPAKMKIIGDRLFVAMQNLNDQWQSQNGEIAVIDLNDHSVKVIFLPVKNPVGKIEYNQYVDKDHFYIACAGSWQKRDGAVLRINIETFESTEILEESDNGGLLDGDFVDLTVADDGDFYIVFSNNSDRWLNRLLKYDTKKGIISQIDSGVNAFAANPLDFSPVTKKIYYFADSGPDTFLRSVSTETGEIEETKIDEGPASVKVWVKYK